MRSFIYITLLALSTAVVAIPITPSASEHQRLAEELRSEGIPEHDIAEQISLPPVGSHVAARPFYSQAVDRLHSLLRSPTNIEKRDMSGDIAPGSLEAPQMLPRAAIPESLADTISQTINAVLRGEDLERRKFGYEGKELEMRRPEGMRHWG
ncbi:hypothetical protein EJ04DRAFT_562899 [Polyplosphaeria fusca]|uniref:Uncharacterized protein n=1 Tax=Polyplosphaeria fusca TaxID=682080 RepID=A0A9P4QYH4_9PLEO|nr:hypothetical protein EJ04DRAFT_562899 [Polyplosphaeria fusca]